MAFVTGTLPMTVTALAFFRRTRVTEPVSMKVTCYVTENALKLMIACGCAMVSVFLSMKHVKASVQTKATYPVTKGVRPSMIFVYYKVVLANFHLGQKENYVPKLYLQVALLSAPIQINVFCSAICATVS